MYRAGIVGLGQIAAGYSGPKDEAPYTHAGGINHCNAVELAAVADISADARESFRAKWGSCFPGASYYGSFAEMLAAAELDIVAICIRGPHHYAAVLQAIEASPKAIFLEKPASCSLAEMDEMRAAAKARKISITVSYTRHWGPRVLRMAQLVEEGLIGTVTHVVGHCPGTFLSLGIHTTDMLCQFANYRPRAVFARGRLEPQSVPDGYEPEPRLASMIVEFEDGITGTQIGHDGEHGRYYCEVNGTAGRARVPFYSDPSAWDGEGGSIDLEAFGMPAGASPFKLAYEQIARHLDGGDLPDCTDDNFAAVNEIGFAAIESVLTDCRIELPGENRRRRIFANG